MKKILMTVLLATFIFQANAQKIDQNNLPKNRFGLKRMTEAGKAEIKRIPSLNINLPIKGKAQRNGKAVTSIDNSDNKFFPPIVSQIGGSCGCASNVHYIYTYESNYLLDRDGKKPENISNYMYIWNFLNDGSSNKGTFTWDVFDTIADNGVIQQSSFNTRYASEWANGYSKYYNGMEYGVNKTFKLDPSKNGGIEKMKQYLIDHADGSQYGGLIQFSAFADPLDADSFDGESVTGCKAMISKFGTDGMHSMTIIGFDDTVWHDFNHNGTKEDDELGAFLCVNSWGKNWGDKGKFLAPYKTFSTLRQGQGGTGNGGKECFIVLPEKRDIKLALKVNLTHSSRNDLKFNVGYATTEHSIKPTSKRTYQSMNHAGGDFKMCGRSKDNIEFGIDISDINAKIEGFNTPTIFLEIEDNKRGTQGVGKMMYCTLIDYSSDVTTQYIGEFENSELKSGMTNKNTLLVKIKPASSASNDNKGTDFSSFDAFVNGKDIMIIYNARQTNNVEIELYDENGVLSAPIFNNIIEKGAFSKKYNAKSLFAGKYTLVVTSDNQIMCKSIEIK